MRETIAAISTGNAPGAIGIVRLSGVDTKEICSKILSKNGQFIPIREIEGNPRKAIYCDLIGNNHIIDQILFVFFKAPHSYTGEDMAELSLHGNPIILKKTLDLLFASGARPAGEGEFTKRAFLNGKLELTRAEAVNRLITARSNFELELAQKNISGELSRLTFRIRSNLINIKAECEAEIDFSTEDLTYETLGERKAKIKNLKDQIQELLQNSERCNNIIKQTKLVIFGSPNTGKSSLLNILAGKDRAIVSHVPGTTRDYLVEEVYIEGVPVQLVDTAGIRETKDFIERMGIEKSKTEVSNANIKLYMLDVSVELDINSFIDKNQIDLQGAIVVANKVDIKHPSWNKIQDDQAIKNHFEICEVSCKTREGINELLKLISQKIHNQKISTEYVLLESRNVYHFRNILNCLNTTLQLIDENAPPEIYIKEIDSSLQEIGMINGKVETEEILGRIFSKFCVGK